MKKLEYQVSFTTPAFLGNAEQQAQWRTPPFKALLRQWWRVAYAADHDFMVNVAEMRREEGLLFGHAWLEDDRDQEGKSTAARKSLVRIRLDVPANVNAGAWDTGTKKGVSPLATGPETSYAWFGLINRGGSLPDRTAIEPNVTEGQRILRIRFPEERQSEIKTMLCLVTAFGQLGSRSRGGWGSIVVDGFDLSRESVDRFTRPLVKCLGEEWAMSIARDTRGPAIWESKQSYKTWADAMTEVAKLRKDVRTTLKSCRKGDLRSALGFAGNGRMPSPLRWKLVRGPEDGFGTRVFAMPHRLPGSSGKSLKEDQLNLAWEKVIQKLDGSPTLRRA